VGTAAAVGWASAQRFFFVPGSAAVGQGPPYAHCAVQVDGKVDESEYGKFGRIMDPEGNRVELWEPPPP